MDLNKKFKTDVDKEDNGTWLNIDTECRVLVARMNNPAYEEELKRLRAPYKQAIREGSMEDEIADRILATAMAKTILLNWEGLELDGKPYPYSYENCRELLLNRAYRQFRNLIVSMAADVENYRAKEVTETGNG